MNKRERVFAAIQGKPVDKIPSGFSLHFPTERAFGEAGVQSHLQFFQETDTDILKIMNENLVPSYGEINRPEDWSKIPSITLEAPFMKAQIELVQRILEKCDRSAFTLGTLHGICASALHPIESQYGYDGAREVICAHLRENGKPVLEAFERITEGMCLLARKYIELGVDAVYYAALGGETRHFTASEFQEYIEPFDRRILSAVKEAGGITVLHICKDRLDMNRYAGYGDLADVVNWGVYEAPIPLLEGRRMFPNAAIMGGLANRSGVLVDGTEEELRTAVQEILQSIGTEKFILGADCTLPTEIPAQRIYAAVHSVE